MTVVMAAHSGNHVSNENGKPAHMRNAFAGAPLTKGEQGNRRDSGWLGPGCIAMVKV